MAVEQTSRTELEDRLKSFLMIHLDVPENAWDDRDASLSRMGISSLNLVRVAAGLEDEFGFEFGDQDLDFSRFRGIGGLVEYIAERRGQNA